MAAAQAFHGLLILFREAAVGEGEEILRQPGLVIECDRRDENGLARTRKKSASLPHTRGRFSSLTGSAEGSAPIWAQTSLEHMPRHAR